MLETCEKYFGTADIYKIFNLSKDSSQSQSEFVNTKIKCAVLRQFTKMPPFTISVQRAYHLLSLETHPDRVAESGREAATRKFQVLSKLYGVLTNTEKKKLFDEKGIIKDDGDDELLPAPTFLITPAHIENCKRLFIGKI